MQRFTIYHFGFSKSTGIYKVGRISFNLIDKLRQKICSENKTDFRRMGLWIWYHYQPRIKENNALYILGK